MKSINSSTFNHFVSRADMGGVNISKYIHNRRSRLSIKSGKKGDFEFLVFFGFFLRFYLKKKIDFWFGLVEVCDVSGSDTTKSSASC